MTITFKTKNSDLLGIYSSLLCTIHCLLTPFLFASRPLLESFVNHQHIPGNEFWSALDYFFLLISLIAVWFSSKHTTHKGVKRSLWTSWSLFAFGLLSEVFHFNYGQWLMYLGSAILVITHLYNYRYCQKCSVNND